MPHLESDAAFYDNPDLKFLCIDDKAEANIFGQFDSASGRYLQFVLKKCTGHSYCKSDDEIKKALVGSYLVILSNEKRFNDRRFGEESI